MIDKDLFKLLGKNKKYIFIVDALMIISLILNLGITGIICLSVNYALNNKKLSDYLIIFGIALIFIALRVILTILISNTKDNLGRNVKKDLRRKVYDKILALGAQSVDGMNMAGLTQISMEGIEQLDIYYSTYLPQFFYAMIAPFILFGITIGLYWQSAVALICLVPFIPISIIAVSKYAKKVFAKYWSKYISMGDAFLDATSGLKDLKIFKADALYNDKMNQNAEEFRKITMKVLVMQLASTTIMDLVAYGGAGLGIGLVILGLKFNWLSSASLALFIILVAVEFFLPMRQFGSAFHIGMNGASAGKKILTLLNEKELDWFDNDISSNQIEFKDVYFSYDGHRDILDDINLNFENKGLYGIVGVSGSGKSTIVSLIMGKIRPNKGSILIDDKEIETLNRALYYSHLAVVSYNTYLFNESIRDNFRLAKPTVKDEEIIKALKDVNMDEFVSSIGGLDYVIREDSANISGGQRQRLCLAINMVANKDIYVFDEATSNIDIDSEEIIINNIKALSKDKLVIIISHRLQNVVDCNRIFYLENGRIKEEGSHEELLSLNGSYNKLYSNQRSLEEGYKEVL